MQEKEKSTGKTQKTQKKSWFKGLKASLTRLCGQIRPHLLNRQWLSL